MLKNNIFFFCVIKRKYDILIIGDTMKFEVRDYKENDLEAVNEILQEAFSTSKKNFQGEQFHELVVCVDGMVAGYCLLTRVLNPIKEKNYLLVDYVCVSQEFQGMGLGKMLMDQAEEIGRIEGDMYLQLTSSYSRIAAHRLYEKCGFIKRESNIFRKELV